ncbi:MAG TPA: ArsB/NhaD family transporter [Candidatus Hydrogenedentes bacterium]|nr:ArsB/NhaD family transporter [Candidatus Hydrogenedentota bacterium]
MILSLIIFLVTFALIITERINRTAASVIGAGLMVLLGLIPHETALTFIDLDVIFLLIGMMLVVGILQETGLFEWTAIWIAKQARGNPLLIIPGVLTTTAILSAFLDNVTTVVLVSPICILIAQILEISAVPFLAFLALYSNIGGTATLIGDPPNILIASKAGLRFHSFLMYLTPVVLLIALVCLGLAWLAFRRSGQVSAHVRQRFVKASPELAITDPIRLKRGLAVFGLILVGFTFGHWIHVDPGIVALTGGFIMLAVCGENIRTALEKVEWEVILLLIGLFVLVGTLEHQGLFELLSSGLLDGLASRPAMLAQVILWGSAMLSALFGNIPVVIALIPLVNTLVTGISATHGGAADILWWSLALGACLGGNGSLYGAAANVVTSQIAHRNGYQLSYGNFLRYAIPVTVLSLLISSLYIGLLQRVL